jgi:hypothetical protein
MEPRTFLQIEDEYPGIPGAICEALPTLLRALDLIGPNLSWSIFYFQVYAEWQGELPLVEAEMMSRNLPYGLKVDWKELILF